MKAKLAVFLMSTTLAVPAGLALAGSATAAGAATAACTRSVSKTTPPTAATVYPAGAAGSVTVGPAASGLTVVSVAPNTGWSSRVDTASGKSVDVYFRMGASKIKFEAGIESPTKLRVLVRTCG